MTQNPSELVRLLRDAIRAHGPLTFAEFMDTVLYHPQHGYYRRAKIGRQGDFMTAVSAGPVFGKIWAHQFRRRLADLSIGNPGVPSMNPGAADGNFQSLENSGAQTSNDWKLRSGARPPAFGNVYEFGGNAGQFRDDVLAECPGLNYRVIEAGDPVPERIEGIVFSNELIDALPFHRLRARDEKLRELFIGLDSRDHLCEIENEPSLAVSDWESVIPDGWEFEICPRAENWIRDIASRLTRGYVITIDYGMTREEYFSKPRPKGTLRCYHKHTQTDDPLADIGEQDITADVDFTRFIAAGEAAGLETILFADQTHALLEIGREVIEGIVARDAGKFSRDRNAIHQLLHPSMMGRRFKVLIQRQR